jgi:hypothetical protein
MNYDAEAFTLKKKWDRRSYFSGVKSFWMQVGVLGSLLLIMGGMLSSTTSVRAFEPNLDYWFTETFTIGDTELPGGVSISTSDPGTSPRGYLILQNKTNTLLFVLSLAYKDVLVMATPDASWENRVNGVHEVASYLVTPERSAVLDMEALVDLDHTLKDQNVLDYELPEEDVPTPDSQSSELLLVFEGQVIEIPFMVSYAPNAEFDNGMAANQAWMESVDTFKATQQAEVSAGRVATNTLIGAGLFIVSAALIFGWLIWRGLSRHRK